MPNLRRWRVALSRRRGPLVTLPSVDCCKLRGACEFGRFEILIVVVAGQLVSRHSPPPPCRRPLPRRRRLSLRRSPSRSPPRSRSRRLPSCRVSSPPRSRQLTQLRQSLLSVDRRLSSDHRRASRLTIVVFRFVDLIIRFETACCRLDRRYSCNDDCRLRRHSRHHPTTQCRRVDRAAGRRDDRHVARQRHPRA